jgi:hypothetical protein
MNATTALRLQLLANGWSPIRNFDKRTFMQGWPTAAITPEEIERWGRRFSRDEGTGLRLDNGLAVADFDIGDPIMKEIANAVLDAIPALADERRPLPIRFGSSFKEAWFFRTAEPFGRLHSRAWIRPGESADEGAHRVEVFGGGSARQFGAFGPHTKLDDGTVTLSYRWLDRSPADTLQSELPILTKEECGLIVDTAEAVLRSHGWTPVLRTQKGEDHAQVAYDLDEAMWFDTNSGERLSLAELRERGDEGLRCSASWLEGRSASNTSRCIVGLTKRGGLSIWESAAGVSHREKSEEPMPPYQAERVAARLAALAGQPSMFDEPGPAREGRQERAAGATGIRVPQVPRQAPEGPPEPVSPEDRAGPAAEKLLRMYAWCPAAGTTPILPVYTDTPETGMNMATFKATYARNVDVAGRTRTHCVDIWLTDANRINVAGIRMRPDRPWPLYEEAGERWINCYRKPVHDAEPEGEAEFDTFMEHLLPTVEEREWQLDCLAHKWMNPAVPGPGVIHVSPQQGAGRGTFFSMVAGLFGERYVRKVDGMTLTGEGSQGQYNRFLNGSLVVTVDEVLSSSGMLLWHRRNTYERLKLLVDPAIRVAQIVQKNQNNYDARVFASFLLATNHENALPLDEDDRRFSVLSNGGRMPEAMRRSLNRFRKGDDWSPGFIAMLARKLEARAAASSFDPYAAPPEFEGKARMIKLNSTDVMDVADQAIEEMPGDYVTRKDFLARVMFMLGDSAKDYKNISEQAFGRLNRRWFYIGRERVNERENKADVWARDLDFKRRFAGSAYSKRVTLLEPNSNPSAKLTDAQARAMALKIKIVREDDDKSV